MQIPIFITQMIQLRNRLPWIYAKKKQAKLREIDSQKRRLMDDEEIHTASRKIVGQIEHMHVFKEAKTVLIYYPMHNEVDLRHLVNLYADQKTFLLPAIRHHSHTLEVRPYVKGQPLKKGYYGIPVPSSPAYSGSIDLIIVPGVCFDRKCHRVGRGGGYYDHFLKKYKHTYTIGVCYNFQLHREIPTTWHDRKMNRVVTPSETIG